MSKLVPKIAVVGSINMDVMIRCEHLPVPGETLIAKSSSEVSGGKGANQAVAAARLGAEVTMIGKVGDDAFAETLLRNLARENINTSHIGKCSNCDSGLAVIAVENSGENSIIVVPGANGTLSGKDVEVSSDVIQACKTLLLQLEVPIDTVVAAIEVARAAGTRIILDPAPAPIPFPSELLDVDLLCPNQSEAARILGKEINSLDSAKSAALEILQAGPRNVIITLGEQGAIVASDNSVELIEAYSVAPVDTTAAGDAFAAALAVSWDDKTSLVEATKFACAAGAITATRSGSQPSLPTREEIDQFVRGQD